MSSPVFLTMLHLNVCVLSCQSLASHIHIYAHRNIHAHLSCFLKPTPLVSSLGCLFGSVYSNAIYIFFCIRIRGALIAYVYACFVHIRHGVYICICTSLTSCSSSFGALKSWETFSDALEHLDHHFPRISGVIFPPFFSRLVSCSLRNTESVSP